jgi:DNA-binding response OmpR family regulator
MAKILIADDDRLIGSMVSFRLTNSGHTVVQAYNGEEASKMASADPPDVMLLDIMMPVMDGLHVLQHLKADPVLHRIPVIMLTALGHEKDVVGCLKAGAADFIVKPFNLNELVARVEAVLRKA